MSSKSELEQRIKELFKEVFTEKCALENMSMTSEESDSINELNPFEVIENLKEIFSELLQFKKDYIENDKCELMDRNEKFESMLQKLEAEIRNHIRAKHELKLHIETSQEQTEELEIKNNLLIKQIKDLSDKHKSSSVKSPHDRKDNRDLLEKIGRLEEMLFKKGLIIEKLEKNIWRLEKKIEGSKENIRKNEGKGEKGREEIDEIKAIMGEKVMDLQRFEQGLKEKIGSRPMKERNRRLKKSVIDNEPVRQKLVENKGSAKLISKVHSRSTSEQIRPLSVVKKLN